jgi:hypothetical protein
MEDDDERRRRKRVPRSSLHRIDDIQAATTARLGCRRFDGANRNSRRRERTAAISSSNAPSPAAAAAAEHVARHSDGAYVRIVAARRWQLKSTHEHHDSSACDQRACATVRDAPAAHAPVARPALASQRRRHRCAQCRDRAALEERARLYDWLVRFTTKLTDFSSVLHTSATSATSATSDLTKTENKSDSEIILSK